MAPIRDSVALLKQFGACVPLPLQQCVIPKVDQICMIPSPLMMGDLGGYNLRGSRGTRIWGTITWGLLPAGPMSHCLTVLSLSKLQWV